MSIESALRRFRRKQADQFTQTANIDRPVGEMTYDPDLGTSVQQVVRRYTAVPCKVTANERQGLDVQVAETKVRIVDHTVKFGVDTDVAMDDLVTITSSTFSPLDVDRQYRITDIDRREWQVSRRCVVEEVMVPMLWEEP